MYYMYSRSVTKDELGDKTVKLKYLKSYLNTSKALDMNIGKRFPISSFGQEDDYLRINGSKTLIDVFDDLEAQKLDYLCTFADVEFIGINNHKQLVLKFLNKDMDEECHSIYGFYNDFFERFKITNFINYCIKEQYDDLINSNIKTLLERNNTEKKQFRLLRDRDNTWGIRALTTDKYKNYDNNIVLYLSLLAAHKYAVSKNIYFNINSAFISDSYMHIFLEQPTPIVIPNFGEAYIGLAISNGEIRNYKFRVEFRYRIIDKKSHKMIMAIFDNPLFEIVHSANLKYIEECLDRFYVLDKYEENVINFIMRLSNIKELSADAAYSLLNDLLREINNSSDISKKTKDGFKKLETDKLINNTVSLIEFFDKVQTISTDMDEKVFIERIFHNVIIDLLNKKNM